MLSAISGLEIFRVISIIAVFQSLFLALFILLNRNERYFGNIILAFILIVFSALIIATLFTSIGIWEKFIRFHKAIFYIRQTTLILGPLVYFYILSIFNLKERFKIKDILHLLPFAAVSVYLGIYLKPLKDFIIWESDLRYYSSGLIFFQNIIYIFFPFISIRSRHVRFSDLLYFKDEPQKFWLSIFMVGFIILWLIKLNIFILADISRIYNICPSTNNLYFLIFFLVINILWYISLKNPEILKKVIKYKNSGISAEEKKRITGLLFDHMREHKPYLNSDLTIISLSKETGIPARQLSQIINEQVHTNFNDFINSYRIEESKKLLKENNTTEKYIYEILYSVSFNSRSCFYHAFKKKIGLTPKEYRRNFIL